MSITHLLYLHGFASSPQSAKAQICAAVVAQKYPQVHWLCPTLAASPKQAMTEVRASIARWPRQHMAIMGSSLGGFYATWLAEQLACKAVLLNPAVQPARDLEPMIGQNSLWHTPDQQFVFDRAFIAELRALEIAHITQPQRYFALIAKGDEVLDWREMSQHYPSATIKLLAASNHGLSDFAQYLDEVLQFLDLDRSQ